MLLLSQRGKSHWLAWKGHNEVSSVHCDSPSRCGVGRTWEGTGALICPSGRSALSEAVGNGPQFLNHFSLPRTSPCLHLYLSLSLSLALVKHLELNSHVVFGVCDDATIQ